MPRRVSAKRGVWGELSAAGPEMIAQGTPIAVAGTQVLALDAPMAVAGCQDPAMDIPMSVPGALTPLIDIRSTLLGPPAPLIDARHEQPAPSRSRLSVRIATAGLPTGVSSCQPQQPGDRAGGLGGGPTVRVV